MTMSRSGCEQQMRRLPSAGLSSGSGSHATAPETSLSWRYSAFDEWHDCVSAARNDLPRCRKRYQSLIACENVERRRYLPASVTNMTQLIESVLGGGGEMGARMRAFDWSATPLGPVEQWPQSLRVCVRIALDSAHPMSIVWGPDLILLYNNENRAMFGAKGATALGRSIRDVFPEMWEYTGPIYDRAMRQRQATVLADQQLWLTRDSLEEGYYTVSFSPIPDDSGHVGGVFVTGIETTGRVIGERRLQVIHDLASRTQEVRYQDEVWRASAAALGEHRHAIPFSILYACPPGEENASRVGASVEPHTVDPPIIDCTRQNLWGFDIALAKEGLVIDLGERASLLSTPDFPVPLKHAAVLPIRFREDSD